MSRIRKRIAERLVQAQHTAAILTTFNEVDMSAVMELRAAHKERFQKSARRRRSASCRSSRAPACWRSSEFPASTPRSAATTSSTSTTSTSASPSAPSAAWSCRSCATPSGCRSPTSSARSAASPGWRATASSRSTSSPGGTFTISNGGVYGSLLSTPILNPPQSGILGMHKIEKRPVVVDDQVVDPADDVRRALLRPPLVDGEQAVTLPGAREGAPRGPGAPAARRLTWRPNALRPRRHRRRARAATSPRSAPRSSA